MTVMIANVGSTMPVGPTTSNASSPPGALTGSLLPSPSDMPTDPLLVLYYCDAKEQQFGIREGQQRLQALQTERRQALQQELDAIEKLVEAAHHKSFWDDLGSICSEIAKVAAVVVSVAAAVASCGAASPLAAVAVAGAVLSAAGFADNELHVLQRLGVSSELAGIVDTGLSVGGAVCSLGTAGLPSTAIGRVSAVVEGVGAIGSGAAAIGSANALADADRAAADQVASEGNQSALRRLIVHLLEELKGSADQSEQTLTTIGKTVEV
jgi:hypothetical protein